MMDELRFALTICSVFVFITISVVADKERHTSPELSFYTYMSEYCRNATIGCPAEEGLEHLTVLHVFHMMSESGREQIEPLCQRNQSVFSCISGCLANFKMSKYGYLVNMCLYLSQIGWERQCWDSDFPREAERCFGHHYPDQRMTRYYPTPMRIYDRHTIARDCFPNDEPHCKYHKSNILLRLMPSYFEYHPYPEGFNHLEDYIGFTRYTHG